MKKVAVSGGFDPLHSVHLDHMIEARRLGDWLIVIVNTDEFLSYKSLEKEGYFHDYVKHVAEEYVKGDCHIQSIEGFWSRLSRET